MSGGLDKASTTESRVLEPLRSGRSKYDMPVVGKKEELLEWPIKVQRLESRNSKQASCQRKLLHLSYQI